MSNIRRRLRGALRNAVVWGIGWGILGFATTMLVRMTGLVDAPVSVLDAIGTGIKVGVVGGIAGTAFSAFIALVYRNRRIQDISWWRFGLGGSAVTTVGMTGLMEGASLLSGGGFVPWNLISYDVASFVVFGFGAAAISIKFAQLATSLGATADEAILDERRSADQLTSGDGATPLIQRARPDVSPERR